MIYVLKCSLISIKLYRKHGIYSSNIPRIPRFLWMMDFNYRMSHWCYLCLIFQALALTSIINIFLIFTNIGLFLDHFSFLLFSSKTFLIQNWWIFDTKVHKMAVSQTLNITMSADSKNHVQIYRWCLWWSEMLIGCSNSSKSFILRISKLIFHIFYS